MKLISAFSKHFQVLLKVSTSKVSLFFLFYFIIVTNDMAISQIKLLLKLPFRFSIFFEKLHFYYNSYQGQLRYEQNSHFCSLLSRFC